MLRVDKSVINNSITKSWIIDALTNPCAALKDPNAYKDIESRNAQGGQLLPLSSSWWVLSCAETENVRAMHIEFDRDKGLIRFRFNS